MDIGYKAYCNGCWRFVAEIRKRTTALMDSDVTELASEGIAPESLW